MSACGLWPNGPRGLVAVVVDDDGHATTPLIALADDERWELLERVDAEYGLDCQLVFPDEMLVCDTICRFALERRHVVWAAPTALVDAICHAAAIERVPHTAAMIARLALIPTLRQHLRRVDRIPCDWRQLSLL